MLTASRAPQGMIDSSDSVSAVTTPRAFSPGRGQQVNAQGDAAPTAIDRFQNRQREQGQCAGEEEGDDKVRESGGGVPLHGGRRFHAVIIAQPRHNPHAALLRARRRVRIIPVSPS